MPIHFDESRWARINERYQKWWSHELKEPLYAVTITDAYEPSGAKPDCPLISQANVHMTDIPAEKIVEAVEYQLSKYEYLGDAYPQMNFDCFGPGVLSSMCGANLSNTSGRVWFGVDEIKEPRDMHIKYDPDSFWARRIKDIYRAGNERWHGNVVMGMADLGSPLDVLAVFRGTQNLLTDLYDEPDEILRLIGETQRAWYDAYADLNSVLQKEARGYSDWSCLFSDKPSYVLQCDFCYMISGDMFKRFVLPSLEYDCAHLTNTIYHLDGVGELTHLPYILSIDDLNAVQWVPGDGMPPALTWIDKVYKPVMDAGKGNQIIAQYCPPDDFIRFHARVPGGLYYNLYLSKEGLNKYVDELKSYLPADSCMPGKTVV